MAEKIRLFSRPLICSVFLPLSSQPASPSWFSMWQCHLKVYFHCKRDNIRGRTLHEQGSLWPQWGYQECMSKCSWSSHPRTELTKPLPTSLGRKPSSSSGTLRSTFLGMRVLIQAHHILAMWPQATYLASLGLGFHICKVGIKIGTIEL